MILQLLQCHNYFSICFVVIHVRLHLAGQTPVSGHLTPTPLVAAYKNHSRKRPAPVTDTFSHAEGVRLQELPL